MTTNTAIQDSANRLYIVVRGKAFVGAVSWIAVFLVMCARS